MKKLTPSLKKFCEDQKLLRIAYVERGGPRVVPIWFVVLGDHYYAGTYANSRKWKAIKRNHRVAWVIDGGKQSKYKGLSMFGVAEEVTDKKLRARIYRALAKKYYGSPDHPKHIEVWGEVDDPSSVYMRLNPEDGFGWEY